MAGGLTSETYPSGRTISTTYDYANRASGVTGQLGQETVNTAYAASIAYAPHGPVSGFVFPNALNVSYRYNSQLQTCSVNHNFLPPTQPNTLLEEDVFWDSSFGVTAVPCTVPGNGSAANNDGTVQGINNYSGRTVPYTNFLTFQQSFSYDKANRLSYAEERNVTSNQPAPYPLDWSRIFNYDGYGNMWVSAPNGIVPPGNTPSAASNFDPGTNRLTSYAGATYDPAGNQTANAGYQVSYDAENRQTAATTTSGPLASYSYDGNGNRVAITTQSGTSFYVYDALGQMAAAYTTTASSLPSAPDCFHCSHL